MACGFFEDDRLSRCAAVRGQLVPSLYEREHYCLGVRSAECPTFRARVLRDDPLPEEVYYAIWLPRSDEDRAAPRRGALDAMPLLPLLPLLPVGDVGSAGAARQESLAAGSAEDPAPRVPNRHLVDDDVYRSCTTDRGH